MPPYIPAEELINKKFGKWEVLSEVLSPKPPRRTFLCRCDCGRESEVKMELLTIGRSKSCGACGKTPRKRQEWHGYSRTPEYRTWQEVMRRCFNEDRPYYKNYGGRGITVCQRWQDSFENFLEDMGKKPFPNYSIERIDTNGNYEPLNCRWANQIEQQRNKRSNVIYVLGARGATLPEWEEILGIPADTMRARIEVYGWTVEEALTTPVDKSCHHKSKSL